MRTLTLAMISAAALVTGSAALADSQKIAVVNIQRVLAEAPQAHTASQTLEAEFGPRGKALEAQKKEFETRAQKFEKDRVTMSEAEQTKVSRELRDAQVTFERRAKEFQEDYQSRQNEELQKVQKAIVEATRAYAKSQNFDIVLADGVIYNSDAVDITTQLLSSLTAKSPAPAAAAAPAPKK